MSRRGNVRCGICYVRNYRSREVSLRLRSMSQKIEGVQFHNVPQVESSPILDLLVGKLLLQFGDGLHIAFNLREEQVLNILVGTAPQVKQISCRITGNMYSCSNPITPSCADDQNPGTCKPAGDFFKRRDMPSQVPRMPEPDFTQSAPLLCVSFHVPQHSFRHNWRWLPEAKHGWNQRSRSSPLAETGCKDVTVSKHCRQFKCCVQSFSPLLPRHVK